MICMASYFSLKVYDGKYEKKKILVLFYIKFEEAQSNRINIHTQDLLFYLL